MNVYLVTLGRGLRGPTHMNGALVLGDKALYFLCASLGKLGRTEFGSLGPIGLALDEFKKTGAQPVIDEAALAALVSSTPNSFVLTPDKIELLSRSMWTGSKIVHDGGQKLVVWAPGFAGAFRDTTREWARSKGIKTKGL